MLIIERADLKNEPEFRDLFYLVKRQHEVADHTIKLLLENSHIENFCVQDKHFAVIDQNQFFISYDTNSWHSPPDQAVVRINRVTIYDDYSEYESHRLKCLYAEGTTSSDGRSN